MTISDPGSTLLHPLPWCSFCLMARDGYLSFSCTSSFQPERRQGKEKGTPPPFDDTSQNLHTPLLLTSHGLKFSYMVKSRFRQDCEMLSLFWVVGGPGKNPGENGKAGKMDNEGNSHPAIHPKPGSFPL